MTAFLIDEMFPTATAVLLRDTYGHDAIHSQPRSTTQQGWSRELPQTGPPPSMPGLITQLGEPLYLAQLIEQPGS